MTFPAAVELADVFEWLALMEAVSFEDFDFASFCNESVERVLAEQPEVCQEFRSIGGNKRLLLVPSSAFRPATVLTGRDIACVRAPHLADESSAFLEAEHAFRELAARGLRVCLLYRACGAVPLQLPRFVAVAHRIEWQAPRCEPQSCSGVVFSEHWHADVPQHTAKILSNFMSTLPPWMQGTVTFH